MEQETQKMLNCDFHIHTPSSLCYKDDDKSDEKYINIIYAAIKKGLDIVCITDHNTLQGYFRIINIIKRLYNEHSILKKYDFNNKESSELEKNLNLLDKICIIPGIELTVDPGFHLILLFDPKSKKEDLVNFFKQYNLDIEECGDAEKGISCNIQTLLMEAKKMGCITIAPHVDSDKGIFNSFEKFPSFRAQILSSSNLDAITCNNEKVKSKIFNLISTSNEYKRKSNLGLLWGSDAHSIKDIGEIRTFIKREGVLNDTFEYLKNAILYSTNYISNIGNFDVQTKINNVFKMGVYYCIEELSLEAFKKGIIGLLNNGYGHLLIGLTKGRKIKGINESSSNLDEKIKAFAQEIKIEKAIYKIESLDLNEGNSIAIVSVFDQFDKMYFIESEIYFYDSEKKEVYVPHFDEIEKRIKKKIFDEVYKIQNKNIEISKTIINSLNMITKSYYHLTLMEKLEKKGCTLFKYIKKVLVTNRIKKYINVDDYGNGKNKGNLYYTPDCNIRLEDTILRYTCPVTDSFEIIEEKKNDPGEYLIVKRSGSTFYINSDEKWNYYSNEDYDVIFSVKDINIKCLLAWLKSTLFIGYCNLYYNSFDYSDINVLTDLIIPNFKDFGELEELELVKIIDLVIENEKHILSDTEVILNNLKEAKISKEKEELQKQFNDLLSKHNQDINELTKEIDAIFIRKLGIEKKELEYISDILTQNKIFDLYRMENCSLESNEHEREI